MSGMINAGQDDSGSQLSNPLLQQAEEKLEAGLDPANRANYMKVVVAGMAAAFQGGPNSIFARLKKNPDPVKGVARGAVALVLILRRETKKGVMPIKAMVPAGLTLMFHGLDLIERMGLAKIGTAELVRASHIFTNDMFGAFKITPPMLQRAAAQVHAIMQDPVKMQAVNLKAGVVKHPNALEPTIAPGAATPATQGTP